MNKRMKLSERYSAIYELGGSDYPQIFPEVRTFLEKNSTLVSKARAANKRSLCRYLKRRAEEAADCWIHGASSGARCPTIPDLIAEGCPD